MLAFARFIEKVNEKTGLLLVWFSLGIVLAQFFVVLGRYVFGVNSLMLQESIVYMHSFLFMLCAAYVLKVDGHVRVDIFYREAPVRKKAKINLFGSIFFLIPMCVVIFYVSWDYVGRSWSILEGSRETSGIPAVFLLKTAIPVFAVQMAFQGFAIILRSLLVLKGCQESSDMLKIEDEYLDAIDVPVAEGDKA